MRIAFFCIILALLCQACNVQTTKPETSTADPEAQARQLTAEGNHFAAADEYMRLSTLFPELAVYYQLKTADSLIRAGETEQANDIVNQANTSRPEDDFYSNLLRARIALLENQGQTALTILAERPVNITSKELLSLWHLSRSEAYEQTLGFMNAAEQRVQLDRYLLDPVEQRRNIRLIWEDLNRVKPAVLNELRSSASETMNAWIALAIINQTMLFKPGILKQALDSWSERYPGHHAAPLITDEIIALSESAVLQPRHIAMLLPLSGQYEKAAHAIRDGFLAAWYEAETDRPLISVYDANALNIENVYRQAVSNGADIVVGPLEKEAIESLMKSGSLEVTTLALNHVDDINPEFSQNSSRMIPKLIQFGLSPEDEARQVAERAIFDGHNKALVITPDNDWGLRLARAFGETWGALGGKVIEYVNYEQRALDYSTPVKELLNIDSSQLRARKLRMKLNRGIKIEPRIRKDADMIFMAAIPLSARQIVPQLRFFQASDIPVYSSSHSYSGVVNVQADSDMNGILFTDIPAVLRVENQSSAVNASLDRNWSVHSSNYRRLYALGVDALHLVPNIGKLSLQDTAVYHGETGDLYMTADGRVLRKLLWARFVNGRARLMD